MEAAEKFLGTTHSFHQGQARFMCFQAGINMATGLLILEGATKLSLLHHVSSDTRTTAIQTPSRPQAQTS